MRVLQLMNEVPFAFPSALAGRIAERDDVELIIASFYGANRGNLDEKVKQLNAKVVPLNATSRFDWRAFYRLRRLIKNEEVDILHTHPNFTGSIARIASLGTGVRLVNTEHNDHDHFSLLQNITNAMTLPLADRIISNSHSTRESFQWYEELITTESQHEVVYNGVDASQTNAGAVDGDLPDSPRLICVGRLVEQKDHKTLLQSMKRVLEACDANLIIVGDGPLRKELERKSVELGIADSVRFTGYLPEREQVFRYLNSADLFVATSEYEGFCVAAVEAMLCGLPLVVSDIDVLREVVDGAGLFAEPGNPDDFAEKILEIVNSEETKRELSEVAEQRSRRKFSLENTAEGYWNIYFDVCSGD